MSMDWIDKEAKEEAERDKKRENSVPAEWTEIKELEKDIREENTTELVQAEVRAPAKQAPNTPAVMGQQLGMPKLCDQCYLIDKCPHYKENASCYFQNAVNIEKPEDLLELTKMMLNMQGERVMFGRFIEQSEGGYIDANLSKEMKLMMELMKDFKDLMTGPQDEISIKVKGNPARAAGEAQGANPSSGGILSQLFGGGK